MQVNFAGVSGFLIAFFMADWGISYALWVVYDLSGTGQHTLATVWTTHP